MRGFSLIEIVIVVFLTSVVLTAVFTLFNGNIAMFRMEQARLAVSGSAREALTDFRELTTQAHRVMPSQSINSVTYSSDAWTLVLQIPSIDSSGHVLGPTTWDYVAFHLNGNKLYEIYSPDPSSFRRLRDNILLSDSVVNLTFTYDNADFSLVRAVTMDLQTSQTFRGNQAVNAHLSEKVRLRN